ncbi:hypothetical protein LCGC14_1787860 [marine sediment metagenome]|uniref:Uncharacterized protein n=1 Tax=marine sediment metagenome TaxID=412755 RepID=A0A0F9HG02_9ZZZZ
MKNKLPVRVVQLTEAQAREVQAFGFEVTKIVCDIYLITFKETTS